MSILDYFKTYLDVDVITTLVLSTFLITFSRPCYQFNEQIRMLMSMVPTVPREGAKDEFMNGRSIIRTCKTKTITLRLSRK